MHKHVSCATLADMLLRCLPPSFGGTRFPGSAIGGYPHIVNVTSGNEGSSSNGTMRVGTQKMRIRW